MTSTGLVGRKAGMTKIFNDEGKLVPVTVISFAPNFVSQIKTVSKDGYSAIQLACEPDRKANKPKVGHFKNAGVEACRVLKEFRVDAAETEKYNLGDRIGVEIFESTQYVDVVGRSIGKGFAGCIKRHNFSGQNQTHGNSLSHRAPGSIGQCQDPGRVFKGKKMPGQMGNVRVTQQNLEVVKVDQEMSVILLKGAVPGPKNGLIFMSSAKKKSKKGE